MSLRTTELPLDGKGGRDEEEEEELGGTHRRVESNECKRTWPSAALLIQIIYLHALHLPANRFSPSY